MHRHAVFIILLGLLIATLAILLLTPEKSLILGLEKESFASISLLGLIALLVASGVSRRDLPFGKMLTYSLIWLAIALVIIVAYQFFRTDKPSKPSSISAGYLHKTAILPETLFQ